MLVVRGSREEGLLQTLQIAQRLLQGLSLEAVPGEVAGPERRLRVVELLARLSDEVADRWRQRFRGSGAAAGQRRV